MQPSGLQAKRMVYCYAPQATMIDVNINSKYQQLTLTLFLILLIQLTLTLPYLLPLLQKCDYCKATTGSKHKANYI